MTGRRGSGATLVGDRSCVVYGPRAPDSHVRTRTSLSWFSIALSSLVRPWSIQPLSIFGYRQPSEQTPPISRVGAQEKLCKHSRSLETSPWSALDHNHIVAPATATTKPNRRWSERPTWEGTCSENLAPS